MPSHLCDIFTEVLSSPQVVHVSPQLEPCSKLSSCTPLPRTQHGSKPQPLLGSSVWGAGAWDLDIKAQNLGSGCLILKRKKIQDFVWSLCP